MNKTTINPSTSLLKLQRHSCVILALAIISALIILISGSNQSLFLAINSQHDLLPNGFWLLFNFFSYSKFLLVPIILISLTYFKRRELLPNVVLTIIAYFVVFATLKHLIGEARPYIALPTNSFYWLNKYEDSVKSAYLSFPSGHTGNMAIFAFSLNILFFSNKRGLQFLMLLLVILTALARICTGWHWPLDVLTSGIIGYILVKICFAINLRKFCFKKKSSCA